MNTLIDEYFNNSLEEITNEVYQERAKKLHLLSDEDFTEFGEYIQKKIMWFMLNQGFILIDNYEILKDLLLKVGNAMVLSGQEEKK